MFLAGLCWTIWLVCGLDLRLHYQVGSLLFSGVIFPFLSCEKLVGYYLISLSSLSKVLHYSSLVHVLPLLMLATFFLPSFSSP